MTVVLHFNKQIPRVIQNRKEKKWDKFVMDTVAGKTLGIVGFGDIGQCVAKMAKTAFGMKVRFGSWCLVVGNCDYCWC